MNPAELQCQKRHHQLIWWGCKHEWSVQRGFNSTSKWTAKSHSYVVLCPFSDPCIVRYGSLCICYDIFFQPTIHQLTSRPKYLSKNPTKTGYLFGTTFKCMSESNWGNQMVIKVMPPIKYSTSTIRGANVKMSTLIKVQIIENLYTWSYLSLSILHVSTHNSKSTHFSPKIWNKAYSLLQKFFPFETILTAWRDY